MKLAIIVILAGILTGCEQVYPPYFSDLRAPTAPHQSISELTRYAKTHGYWWRIYCASVGHNFQAEMCKANCAKYYIEDGDKGRWAAQGDTQEDAAFNLLYGSSLDKASWLPAEHTPEYKHKQCPPELHGGPQ